MIQEIKSIDELRRLLSTEVVETETLEFKGDWTEGKIQESLVALSNSRGGTIFVGVRDGGPVDQRIVGVADTDPARLANLLDQIEPQPVVRMGAAIPVDERRFVVQVIVDPGPFRPYLFRGKALKRLPGKNAHMTRAEIEEAFAGGAEQVQKLRLLVRELARSRNLLLRANGNPERRDAEVWLTQLDTHALDAVLAAPPALLRSDLAMMSLLQRFRWGISAFNERVAQAQTFAAQFYGPDGLRLDVTMPSTFLGRTGYPRIEFGEQIATFLAGGARVIPFREVEDAARTLARLVGDPDPELPDGGQIFQMGKF